MQIKDLFEKKIDRDIRGVIKVEQEDVNIIKQELEEYVVTRELSKHFNSFFANYAKGINGVTDKMGVWISGFFGSGKSHFLKILSYILDGKIIDGKKAVDYFVDSKKIIDPMTIANMKLASNTSTDVILFNIDSKSAATSKKDKEAILSVFLRVFNEKLGFCGTKPFVADLERKLTAENRYDEFKTKFENLVGKSWLGMRHEFGFIQDNIIDILVDMKIMSEAAARSWCENAMGDYSISIGDFAQMVKKYIASKGKNHHILFMVDEVGQYVGDTNDLMLNLQTVTEDLGTACGGKAWIIVTGQQDIDSITKVIGNNLSKIKGRFDTTIALSSADVDEVIRKRILAKTETAKPMLEMMYDQKASIIKNAVIFSDTAEMKLYQDRSDFAADYPFIPYQFNLLGRALNSIREHSSSGKHMSEGERSMIALFQESAISVMTKEEGILVPFCNFYTPIEKFIDHSHSSVISNAAKNSKLVDLDVQILKVLFMIKYVKEIVATVDNITTLMLSAIDQDKLLLRKEVEESLQRLIKQTLVQKTLVSGKEVFVFLTNEEQEIARDIANTTVESVEIINKIADMLFNDIYQNTKFKYNNNHNYAFNKMVDDRYWGGVQSNDIGIKIITPLNGSSADASVYRMQSTQEKNVFIVLPEHMPYYDEIRSALQIEKYLTKNSVSTALNIDAIKRAKQIEAQERKQRARLFLAEAVKGAEVYVDGNNMQSTSKEASTKIDEAIKKLFNAVYNKLSYMEVSMTVNEIHTLFRSNGNIMLDLSDAKDVNTLALKDVLDFIEMNTYRKVKTSIKTLKDRYQKAPYGFNEEDVEWIVAKLFKNGDINMMLNSEIISITGKSADDIVRYITRKEYLERLLLEKREKVSDRQKKSARQILDIVFKEGGVPDEEDYIMNLFKKRAGSLINYEFRDIEKQYIQTPQFPGGTIIKEGRKVFETIIDIENPAEFFKIIDNRVDDMIEFHDDYEKIKEFFKGEQVTYFSKSLQALKIYDESKTYITDTIIDDRAKSIREIVKMNNPYGEIYRLPEFLEAFYSKYNLLLDSLMNPALDDIKDARNRVFEELDKTEFKDKQTERVIKIFNEFQKRAESSVNIATLKNLKYEVEAMRVRLINEFAEAQSNIDNQKKTVDVGDASDAVKLTTTVKPRRTVTLRSIISGQCWNVASEADVDKCVADIKSKLMKEIASGDIIKVED